MKSLLINLHGDTNMTAAYLHSLIDKAGFEINTIHFRRLFYDLTLPSYQELSTLKKLVDNLNPKVVLMSVNSMSFWIAVELSKLLKGRKIVWGGVQPLIEPERCLEYADIIVRGEGDEAIIELLTALQKNKSYNNIKNIWTKKGDKIIKNDFRLLIDNLDILPIPDYSNKNKFYLLGTKIYRDNPLPHSKYEYNITFSRGCPFSCKYCLNHFLNKIFNNKYLRRKSVASAISELIQAKKLFPKLKSINFWDDVFMLDNKWLREFAKEYKQKINLPFFAYGNATFVNEENMKLLKHAGISFFDLGLQSGSWEIRNKIFGRIDTDEQILKADKIIHKLKIPVGYDIIFSEFETEESMEKGIEFLLKLQKPFKVQRNKLAYYPNFDITNLALKEKKITLDQIASKSQDIRSQIMNANSAERYPSIVYYYLLGKKLIPNVFVKFMLKNKWHYKHPKLLRTFGKLIDKLENFRYSFKSMFIMLARGEIRYVYNRLLNIENSLA
jgi:radical SAM superfamily enzyme YgiQ (UPF0313 family)